MKTWTVEEMMEERPCYTVKRVRKLWNGRESLSLLDICNLDIPTVDILWAATLKSSMTSYNLYERWLMDKVVDPCVAKHCLHCGISKVEQWAQGWISGKDRSGAAATAAAEAARAAARAARDAAWAAAWAAAEAAMAAAGDAAWDAAWAAARAAAWAAAWAAAVDEQVNSLRALLIQDQED